MAILQFLKWIAFCLGSGIILAFGIGLGFLLIVALLVSITKKKNATYKAQDLLDAFNAYRKKAEHDEAYEQLPTIDEIVKQLINDKIPDAVKDYIIKSESSIYFIEENDRQVLRAGKKYTILGLKEDKQKTKS